MLKANSSDDFGITTPIIDILFLLVMVFFSLLFFSQVENYHASSSSPGVEATSKYSKESLDKLSKENEYRYKEIKQKQKQTKKMEAELAYLKKSVPSEQTIEDKKHIPIETQIESEKLTKEIENTRQIVAKLQQQVATFEKERIVIEELRTDLLGRDDELRQLRQRATRLANQLAEIQRHLLQPTKQTINVQGAPSIVYLDANGYVTDTPTNKIRVVSILQNNEPNIDGQYIREQGLFAGDATEEKNSGTLLGVVNHRGQWKTEGSRIRKTIELSI